jgi:hypothetical protein
MADSGRRKLQSQFDSLVNSNPQFKKELERRIKYARSQGASLAEQSKEELRYRMLALEEQLASSNRQLERVVEKLRLQELSLVAGEGNAHVGQLKITNLQLQAEKENLEIALKDLQRVYSKVVSELTAYRAKRG